MGKSGGPANKRARGLGPAKDIPGEGVKEIAKTVGEAPAGFPDIP